MVFYPYPLIPAGMLCNSSGNKKPPENLWTITVLKETMVSPKCFTVTGSLSMTFDKTCESVLKS